MTDAAEVVAAARALPAMIAVAESCTGGLLAARLTAVAGASDVFDRGFVTYSNAAKQQLLGVSARSLERFGAVSEEVAAEMAHGALSRSEASVALAITGVAGPGAAGRKPEGRVCFAVASALGTETETVEFGALGRDRVRDRSVDHALALLRAAMSPRP